MTAKEFEAHALLSDYVLKEALKHDKAGDEERAYSIVWALRRYVLRGREA
jgi:hypothetical protein